MIILEIRKQIKNIMAEEGITQRELSDMSGISFVTINSLINDRRDARLSSLEMVVEALGYEIVLIPKNDGDERNGRL